MDIPSPACLALALECHKCRTAFWLNLFVAGPEEGLLGEARNRELEEQRASQVTSA